MRLLDVLQSLLLLAPGRSGRHVGEDVRENHRVHATRERYRHAHALLRRYLPALAQRSCAAGTTCQPLLTRLSPSRRPRWLSSSWRWKMPPDKGSDRLIETIVHHLCLQLAANLHRDLLPLQDVIMLCYRVFFLVRLGAAAGELARRCLRAGEAARGLAPKAHQQVRELLVLGLAGVEVAEDALEPLGRRRVAERHQRKDQLRDPELRLPAVREQLLRAGQGLGVVGLALAHLPALGMAAVDVARALVEQHDQREQAARALAPAVQLAALRREQQVAELRRDARVRCSLVRRAARREPQRGVALAHVAVEPEAQHCADALPADGGPGRVLASAGVG